MIDFKLRKQIKLQIRKQSFVRVVAAGSAILQGGIFGLSSMFPGKYTQAVMGGMVRIMLLFYK